MKKYSIYGINERFVRAFVVPREKADEVIANPEGFNSGDFEEEYSPKSSFSICDINDLSIMDDKSKDVYVKDGSKFGKSYIGSYLSMTRNSGDATLKYKDSLLPHTFFDYDSYTEEMDDEDIDIKDRLADKITFEELVTLWAEEANIKNHEAFKSAIGNKMIAIAEMHKGHPDYQDTKSVILVMDEYKGNMFEFETDIEINEQSSIKPIMWEAKLDEEPLGLAYDFVGLSVDGTFCEIQPLLDGKHLETSAMVQVPDYEWRHL